MVKITSQTRASDLALLVQEVAFGNQDELKVSPQRRNNFLDPWQQLDWTRQHRPSPLDNLADRMSADTPIGKLNGGLDHRKGKALDPITKVSKVACLCRIELFVDPF